MSLFELFGLWRKILKSQIISRNFPTLDETVRKRNRRISDLNPISTHISWEPIVNLQEVEGADLLELDPLADNRELFNCYDFPSKGVWVKGKGNEEEIQWSDGKS